MVKSNISEGSLKEIRSELQAIRKQLSTGREPPVSPWLTEKEAAAYLKISISTIRNYRRDMRITHYRPDGRVFYNVHELDEFIQTRSLKSII